ncbi:MAG: hypothetical protein M5U30_19820 [Burkholderiaceae bacterium]|nr:hypothetical protein [Burkholderiaceae bacterium]
MDGPLAAREVARLAPAAGADFREPDAARGAARFADRCPVAFAAALAAAFPVAFPVAFVAAFPVAFAAGPAVVTDGAFEDTDAFVLRCREPAATFLRDASGILLSASIRPTFRGILHRETILSTQCSERSAAKPRGSRRGRSAGRVQRGSSQISEAMRPLPRSRRYE